MVLISGAADAPAAKRWACGVHARPRLWQVERGRRLLFRPWYVGQACLCLLASWQETNLKASAIYATSRSCAPPIDMQRACEDSCADNSAAPPEVLGVLTGHSKSVCGGEESSLGKKKQRNVGGLCDICRSDQPRDICPAESAKCIYTRPPRG